ncbi:MAG: type II secretion system GspH family protein [Deltaproteobacteria bacterium]|nr:type II secretion system GspH family protein [Deltaproteobacteria bacterium]
MKNLKPYASRLRPYADSGFTLLEILLAIFILTLVVSAVFGAFRGTFKVVDDTEAQEEIYAAARVALERISEDLASVYGAVSAVEKTPDANATRQQVMFLGEDHEINDKSADNLRFLSWAHVSFKTGRPEEGPAEISYYTQYQEETGELALYRSDTLDYLESPDPGQGGLLLCEGLKWLDFIYYDENGNAHKEWAASERNNEAPLPARVEISIGFENALDPENPLQFVTGVALPPLS